YYRTVLLDKVIAAVFVDVPRHLLAKVIHQKLFNLFLILVVVQFILNKVRDELTLDANNIFAGSRDCGLFHVVTINVVQKTLRNAQTNHSACQIRINVLSEHLNQSFGVVGNDGLAALAFAFGSKLADFGKNIKNFLVGGIVLKLGLNNLDNLL